MKILHIFGAVVAVHLAVFLVIFAVPGCRSTGKAPQSAASTVPIASAPGTLSSSEPSTTSVLYAPAANVRFSPTRPGTATSGLDAVQKAGISDSKPSATYLVVKGDSLWTVAKKNGVTVNELVKANALKPNAALKLGQKLVLPAGGSGAAVASVGSASGALSAESTGPTHTVKGGETLGQIAKTHGTTVNTLKKMNGLTNDNVRPGKVLLLPEGSVSSMEPVASTKTPSAMPSPRSGASFKHTVKPGETLGAIARRYSVSAGELGTANNITDPRRIRPGQELTIPGWSAPKTPAPASTVPSPANVPSAQGPTLSEQPATLSPVEPPASPQPNTDVPVIRIEDPSRTPGTEAPRVL